MAQLSPPRLALWIIEHATPARDRDAVVGDVIEDFWRLAEASPAAARQWCRRQALRSLVPGLQRQLADIRPAAPAFSKGHLPMRGFLQDLAFGVRLLRHQPLMAAAGVTSLAIGLGLNILLFTLANAILLRPLPLAGADRLVLLQKVRETGRASDFSYPAYLHLRDSSAGVFDTMTAHASAQVSARLPSGDMQWLDGEYVTGNFFRDLGVPMSMGRGLSMEDDKAEAPPAVVVSDRFWRRHFAGQTLSGQTLTLNDRTFTIAGVADRSFLGMQLGRDSAFWVPVGHSALLLGRDLRSRPTTSWLVLTGRLAPGTSREAATARLSPSWSTYATGLGYAPESLAVEPGSQGDSSLQTLERPLRLLSFASLFVLLIACVNVANLQLARAAARGPEFAVRAALGAGRARLASLLVADAVILTVPAAVAAIGAAALLREPASSLIARFGQRVTLDLPMDVRVMGAAVTLTAVAALIVGGLSAWLSTRNPPSVGMAAAGRANVGGAARTQRGLVVIQFALSMTLVAGAALLVRTVSELRGSDIGFARNVALLDVSPAAARYTPQESAAYYERVVQQLTQVPGVEAAALAVIMPLDFGGSRSTISVPGYTPAAGEDMELNNNRVSPAYFDVMRISLVAGRYFDERDTAQAPRTMIVNETLASRYFPGGHAVGRQIGMGSSTNVEIVGIVRDVRYRMVREAPRPSFYLPIAQSPVPFGAFHVRTSMNPELRLADLERAVAAADPRVPVTRTTALERQLDRNIATERMARTIAMALGLAALVLAATGLYATMAFAVRRRTREIGVRMALGARAADVRLMIVRQSLSLVAAGVVIGLAGAAWAGRAVESQLYGVSPLDVWSFAGAALLLAVAALLAAWIPARRATRVDPVIALRDQ